MRLDRPVTAAALLATAEMRLRYPGEIELRRGGADEGQGRGFDDMDLSAAGKRTIAVAASARTVLDWLVAELAALGWADEGDGLLSRDEAERFLVRIERDRGVSRLASLMSDPNRRIQEDFEASYYEGAPEGASVLTLFYTVAPEAPRIGIRQTADTVDTPTSPADGTGAPPP